MYAFHEVARKLSVCRITNSSICSPLTYAPSPQTPVTIILSLSHTHTPYCLRYAMFAGLATIVAILSLNNYISRLLKAANDRVQTAKDARMADVSGCFSSSLVIKLNSWEKNFITQIFASRNEELKHVWTVLLLSAVNICLLWLAPCLVSVGTISTYAHLESEISAANVFTALALFKSLQDPFRDLPAIITQYV